MTGRVVHNEEKSRYEIHVDCTVAGLMDYQEADGIWTIPHTEVDPAFQGQGLAGELVNTALVDIRARGGRIRPLCSYVVRYVEDHPEFADLLA